MEHMHPDGPAEVVLSNRGRRAQVLGVLMSTADLLSTEDVAEAVGVHPNTARFHLEALVASSLASRHTEERTTPGRRRVLYGSRPVSRGNTQFRALRMLAEMLSRLLAEQVPDASHQAFELGKTWGAGLLPDGPREYMSMARALSLLRFEMEQMTFSPAIVGRASGAPQLLLNNCPFASIASHYPEVVCRLHLGMIAGMLEASGARLSVVSAEMGHRPGQCLVQLASTASSAECRDVDLRKGEYRVTAAAVPS